jgi:hypothetical protein
VLLAEGVPSTSEPATSSAGGPELGRPPRERAITTKSVFTGFVGVIAVTFYAHFNDRVLKLSPLIGNHLPVGTFTLILLLGAVWNPLLGRVWRKLAFSTGELAVVVGMMLVSSWVPSSGFYRYFHHALIMPWLEQSQHPSWQAAGTLTHLPARLFPLEHAASDPRYDQVYGGFVRGLADADARLPLAAAPFAAWLGVVVYWGPLLATMALCLGALMWMVHRQWSQHEQLAYPIASVLHALIARTRPPPALIADVFRSRLFWAGFAPVFSLHMLNYGNAWFPTRLPRVPLSWQAWGELRQLFPVLASAGYQPIATGRVSFLIVGIAYFIASEISLSMGLTTTVLVFVGAQFFMMTGAVVSPDDHSATLAGAYLAYFVILAFVGRRYYFDVLKRALVGARQDPDPQATWAGRLFLLGGVGWVCSLTWSLGIDWLVALLYAGTLVVFFLVFARVIAETGIPFCQPNFDAGVLLGNMFGLSAIGPAAFVMIVYVGLILNPDARESMTPYVVNTLKLAERTGVPLARMMMVGASAIVLTLVIGFFAQTYNVYDRGARDDEFAMQAPAYTVDLITLELSSLRASGREESAAATHGLGKLRRVADNIGHGRALGFLAFGAVGVWALSLLRFRVAWWPLHPVMLLMWGTWTATLTWASFLIGWLLKELIVRLAGGAAYQRLKPMFIGVITGEMLAVAVTMLVGYIYYALTGLIPKNPAILPG